MIMSPFLIYLPTILEALNKGFRSGFLFILIGVGTVTIKQFAPSRSFSSLVKLIFLFFVSLFL